MAIIQQTDVLYMLVVKHNNFEMLITQHILNNIFNTQHILEKYLENY